MKETIKSLLCLFARLLILPTFLTYLLTGLICSRARVFPFYTQSLALLPGTLGMYLRREFYRMSLTYCAKDCWIGFGTTFSVSDVWLGSASYIGNFCSIGRAEIKAGVSIASHVSIVSGLQQHKRNPDGKLVNTGIYEKIIIGENAWIGERALVAADIGDNSTVGAGGVVVKSVANNVTVVGNPAREI